MINCKQCGNPCGVGAELCRRYEELNKILVENLVQTAAAELALEVAKAGFEPAGDGALSYTFIGGGGDFGGGGASGDF